ncbi:MAG: hypothetical protein KAU60_00540, partial [Desulfobacterales bacterium]|nr:hypothetical protein [Desulfobacterales bacterium]
CNMCNYSATKALRALHNTSIVIASDTRRKRLRCASEEISQHVDNPQDCFVVSLLAMTKIDQKEAFCKGLTLKL